MANIPLPPNRTYDLKKPPGHKPAIPRYTLRFPDSVSRIYTLYVGVQCRSQHSAVQDAARGIEARIQQVLDESKSEAQESFRVTEGLDLAGTKVWAAYFTSSSSLSFSPTDVLSTPDLEALWRSISSPETRSEIGLWREQFETPLERLETNFSALQHRPGLAAVEGTEGTGHELTGYWGAGRDRIPASGADRFEAPDGEQREGNGGEGVRGEDVEGIGEVVEGENWENMCHIRSGQWWAACSPSEREAYESKLEPVLMDGMRYLWNHPHETGTLGLRFLRNTAAASAMSPSPNRNRSDDETLALETSGAGFHANWSDLELWASRHPSHLRIFTANAEHSERFGGDKKFMTWHEVSILKEGEARWGYVNCARGTGMSGKGVKGRRRGLEG